MLLITCICATILFMNIITGTDDVLRWRNESRDRIQTADWLTGPLVESGTLPEEFYGARIAPIVIGLATPAARDRLNEYDVYLKGAIDSAYLMEEPELYYNPHYELKNTVRNHLTGVTPGKKKPLIIPYPGYIFPDVSDGTLFLDGTLCDSECSPEAIKPAASVLALTFSVSNIVVGNEVLVSNSYGYTPEASLPAVVRAALAPTSKHGVIDISAASFTKARREIIALED
jgi:hypothetical protein